MCQKCWANHLAEHALNLSQVTIHTYWEGLHWKKHKNSHLPKPCPAAMWHPEYPVSVTLTKLINKQNLFHTVIVRNFPWITESAFYCSRPGFPTQVCLASHSSPQNLSQLALSRLIQCKPEFLNSGTINNWDWIFLCCKSHLVHNRMFNSLSGLYPWDAT